MSQLAEEVAARAAFARERIARAGADPDQVRIVAVTKGFGPEEVAAGFAAGLRDFGENYADELVAKWPTRGHSATWHFLGAVQRNKVGRLAALVDCWQAVARVVEGEAIRRHFPAAAGDGAGPRAGVTSCRGRDDRCPGPGRVCPRGGARRRGGPYRARLSRGRAYDGGATRRLGHGPGGLRPSGGLARGSRAAELSMGMSEDLEQAVAAGATMVRLGTCLFGPRPNRRRL